MLDIIAAILAAILVCNILAIAYCVYWAPTVFR